MKNLNSVDYEKWDVIDKTKKKKTKLNKKANHKHEYSNKILIASEKGGYLYLYDGSYCPICGKAFVSWDFFVPRVFADISNKELINYVQNILEKDLDIYKYNKSAFFLQNISELKKVEI